MSAIKLEACPFCGSDDVKVYHDTSSDHRYDWEFFVECQSCAASGSQWKHEEDAIAAWNRRAQPAEEVQRVAVVEDDRMSLLVKALKGAREPIADDCRSFSTHRKLLAQIDAALAAKDIPSC